MPIVIDDLEKIGGLFSIFVLLHFVADWVFQTHQEAMNKTKHWRYRLKHCGIYTGLMLAAIFTLCHISPIEVLLYGIILFVSHFLEDSYIPIFYWAKYFRQAPELNENRSERNYKQAKSEEELTPTNNLAQFKLFASQPIGLILLIVIDQIVHIIFLLPIAQMILLKRQLILTGDILTVFIISCIGLLILAILNIFGDKNLHQTD